MPLPLILGLGIGTGVSAVGGIKSGVSGVVKIKDASKKMKEINARHENNIQHFKTLSEAGNKTMDKLGTLELEILKSFNDFSDLIEKIQNRPIFKEYNKDDVTLPEYDAEEIKKVSIGAGVALGSLEGLAAGAAGGFAASGAATSAVMALGTASTGTAISTLSGAAATNATLAALGGGSLATGGGGIALGTTILGASAFGVGVLVGGAVINATGKKLSAKVDEAEKEMLKAEKTINESVAFLRELSNAANRYIKFLTIARDKYNEIFNYLSYVINNSGKTDWNLFSDDEKLATQNLVLLVGLLYKMCQVSLVKKANSFNDDKVVNTEGVSDSIHEARTVLSAIQ